jgi:hypothetical protein
MHNGKFYWRSPLLEHIIGILVKDLGDLLDDVQMKDRSLGGVIGKGLVGCDML